jgi:GPH family glycoside/pentoside/hexuronide:cation symporter
LFGLVSLANKTSLAVGTWALAGLLASVGFVPNVDQSPETLQGLRKIMTLVPIIGFLASAAIIAFFPFNTGQHADMIREIRQRRVDNSDAQ